MSPRLAGRPTSVDPTEVVLTDGTGEVASWPLPCDDRPDLALVDELCRLQLAARRLGWEVRLRGAAAVVTELLELAGLAEVVGEAEGGEEVGVEEVVVTDDPVA